MPKPRANLDLRRRETKAENRAIVAAVREAGAKLDAGRCPNGCGPYSLVSVLNDCCSCVECGFRLRVATPAKVDPTVAFYARPVSRPGTWRG